MNFFKNVFRPFKNSYYFIKSKIKSITQKYEYDCGPAAVGMMLDFYDLEKDYPQPKLRKILQTNQDGTYWKNIKKFFNSFQKFKVIQYYNDIESAKNYLGEYPLFICWNIDLKYSHYSVLIYLDDKIAAILDPYDSEKVSEEKIDYFMQCWKMLDCWFTVLIPKENAVNRNKLNLYKQKITGVKA